MNKNTKEYRVKVEGSLSEHKKIKKEIEKLVEELNGELGGYLEFYTQSIEPHSYGDWGRQRFGGKKDT